MTKPSRAKVILIIPMKVVLKRIKKNVTHWTQVV